MSRGAAPSRSDQQSLGLPTCRTAAGHTPAESLVLRRPQAEFLKHLAVAACNMSGIPVSIGRATVPVPASCFRDYGICKPDHRPIYNFEVHVRYMGGCRNDGPFLGL